MRWVTSKELLCMRLGRRRRGDGDAWMGRGGGLFEERESLGAEATVKGLGGALEVYGELLNVRIDVKLRESPYYAQASASAGLSAHFRSPVCTEGLTR